MKHSLFKAAVLLYSGMLLAKLILPGMPVMLGIFFLIIALLFISRHNKKNLQCILLVIVLFMGMFEYKLAAERESKFEAVKTCPVKMDCVIINDPIARQTYTEYIAVSKMNNCNEKMLVQIKGDVLYKYGDLIRVTGELKDAAVPRNPGDFDFKLYYQSKGIYKTLKVESAERIKENQNGIIANVFYASKNKIKRTIYAALPEEQAVFLYGIITGDKTNMDEEMITNFARAGLSHILSVSGLHVGFLVFIITFLLLPLKLDKRIEGFILLAVIGYYILLIGAPAPAVRAFIMFAVLQFGKLLGRKYDLLASVSFAAIIILIVNPLAINDPGFIISFACMYAIALLYEPVEKKLRFLPLFVRGSISLSISIFIGITPILVCYFNYISLISIPLNIIAVPISFLMTIVGFIGVIVGSILPVPALYIFSIDFYLIKVFISITEACAKLPLAGFNIPNLPFYLYIVYYFGVLFFVEWFNHPYFKIYKNRFIFAGLLLLATVSAIYILPGKNLRMVFFDVGQGDSICIVTPSKQVILVDGGGSSSIPPYYYDIGGKVTVPALLHQGVWRIDTVIVSHIHDDHLEGLISVLESFSVKNIVFPQMDLTSPNYEKLIALCKKKQINIAYLKKGDQLKFGKEISMKVLWPENVLLKGTNSDINNSSLVLKLAYKNFDVLLAGDAEKEVEEHLEGENIASDILKVAHHGSKNSTTDALVKSVSPKYAVISVGVNIFGHPSEDTIERLENYGCEVLRTDINGAVTILTDGNHLHLKTVR